MKPRRLALDHKKLGTTAGYLYLWEEQQGYGMLISTRWRTRTDFSVPNITLPYRFIGVVETDQYPVYFSTDNTNSAIGFHDTDNDIYIPIIADDSATRALSSGSISTGL